MRIASARPSKGRAGGWLHKLDGSPIQPQDAPAKVRPIPPREMFLMAESFRTAVNPERLAKLAERLGLSVDNLKRLCIGWSTDSRAWAFPMTDAAGQVLGIRLRTDAGKKFAVKGGHEGLFIPQGCDAEGPLCICEGPTSCCALLDLGFAAIGRPSCLGGVDLVKELLSGQRKRDVVIFGDHDSAKPRPDGSTFHPGQDGARALAKAILPLCRSLKVVIPPACKDARDWKAAGATHRTVLATVEAANYWRATDGN